MRIPELDRILSARDDALLKLKTYSFNVVVMYRTQDAT